MSTVKITDLPQIITINANTANTVLVGVDIPTDVTGKITLTTLARGLYSNNNLIVGNTNVYLPNAIAQYTGNSSQYIQTSIQNIGPKGSGDMVVTADNGTDTTYFIDVGMAGSQYVFAGDDLNKPNDGYIIMAGGTPTDPGGNLSIGTLTAGKDINIFQGGTDAANVVATFGYSTGLKLSKKPLTFSDGTTQNTAVTYTSIDSRITANAASANVVINSRITSNITTANTFTQAAFDKANNALANTSGIFAGNLTITGNTQAASLNTANLSVVGTANVSGTLNVVGTVSMNATLVMSNVNFNATESAVTISASQTVAAPANDGYMLHISGKDGIPSRIVSDSYGTGAYSVYTSRTARGNVAVPTAVQTGDIIGRFSANGYGTTKFQQFGTGRIDFIASENYTDANTGSQIKFWNCAVGSNTLVNILTLNGNSAEFTGFVNPQKGFVYTPRLPAGNQTTITIDYANDSIIKANLVADLTVSHSNFTTGKVVELWLLNSGGTNRTVTHGISALNSTTNSTTFTIPSTSSAYLRFFSIDGDLANTFVSVVHA